MHDASDVIPWDDVIFIDCETRSALGQENPDWANVTTTSTRRYAVNAWPIIITWAHGLEGEVKRWEIADIDTPPTRDDMPEELITWGGYFAAWNSGFDRAILDPLIGDGIGDGVDEWLDMMAQAAYNNIPLGLDRAAKTCGYDGKIAEGKKLIRLFCSAGGARPEERPEEWKRFCEYADVDVLEMQQVMASTMPVPYSIWQEFWASERINDRGIPVDIKMAEGGAALAEELSKRTKAITERITHGALSGVKQYAKQPGWVYPRLAEVPKIQRLMIEAERENPETGEPEYKFKMDRPVITKMVAALEQMNEEEGLIDEEKQVLDFLIEREFGASAAPAKFPKMLSMHLNGRLPNQYVFGGATQTGRFSSRGVQAHNLTRSTIGDLDREEMACLALINGMNFDDFEQEFGNVGKALSRLIRPCVAAESGKMLVWGDWSNIEARGLPWLARAEERLDMFRKIDADPENEPDVYLQAAAGMYHKDKYVLLEGHRKKDPEVKDLRQKGKISELALGFNGGPGALQSMAANYGMQFEATEAADIVDRWRAANEWAVDYWQEVWQAFLNAYQNPGEQQYEAGRVTYQGVRMGNKIWVVCLLPDNRALFYRDVRERVKKEYDPFDPTVVISKDRKLSFEGEGSIKYLWPGLLVENITQAVCASILRDALVYMDQTEDRFPVVMHTHDECVLEVDEDEVEEAKRYLELSMMRDPGWHDGFPLGVDIDANLWYSKAME